MPASKDKVGVIGLGIMGGAFARHLAAAGWDVSGYDLDAKCRKRARAGGVTPAADVAEVARKSPVIILSLPSAKALHAVADAIAAAKVTAAGRSSRPGTFSLDDKMAAERTLRAAGHIVLDCPVSGTGSQVKSKDIVIYASGPAKTIASLRPMFATFSRAVHDLGAFGNGSRDEVRGEPSGRDPQRRQRRGDGARHEGRARCRRRSSSSSPRAPAIRACSSCAPA